MRILLLTVDFPPSRGGIQNLLANLADGLASGHDVSVVAPRSPNDASWDRLQRYGITRAPRARFWPAVMFWCLCVGFLGALKRRPDAVVCGHALLGPVCFALSRIFGVPFVLIAHAYEIRAPRMRRLAGWTLRRAAMVVSVSDFTRRSVMTHGVAPERIAVIHPGAGSRPPAAAPAVSRAEPEEDGRIILTVARLGELYKGHDMVLRAMPLILARQPGARYVIVGGGPLRAFLERLAAAHNVAQSVTFTGELSDEDLERWYERADVFVLASRESPVDGGAEGFGLSFIEAGVRGKPVVGGNSGGVPDAVIDGVTGLLVDPTDVQAIADAILAILGDPELAARLGARGRDRALNDLSWSNFVAAFASVLDAAIGAPAIRQGVGSARS